MEPATFGLGALAWEYGIKPVVDSLKKEYGEIVKIQIKTGLSKAFAKLPFKKNEIELIEAEIVEADVNILENKEKFLEFFEDNIEINKILKQYPKKVIINSLVNIEKSSISVSGSEKIIDNSFKNIKNSQIKL